MTKNEYIDKLNDIYGDISAVNRPKADQLIDRLAEVMQIMDECREDMKKNGLVTEMSQGKYSIERENPHSKIYDAKAKIMISLMGKLDKMQEAKTEPDELMQWIGSH